MRKLDIISQALGTSKESASPIGEESSRIDRAYRENLYQLQGDPTKSAAPELMQTGEGQGTTTNMWRTFRNAIDEIDKGSLSGKKRKFDSQIDQLSKQLDDAEQIEDAIEKERVKYALRQQIEQLQNSPEYHTLERDILDEEESIAERYIDPEFAKKTDEYRLQKDKNLLDTLRYELPQTFGGSFSDIENQFMSIVAPQITKNILETGIAAIAPKTGPLSPYITGGITAAAAASSMYFLYKSRENETDAEVSEAFDTKYRQLQDAANQDRLANNQLPLDESNPEDAKILRAMRLEADKGLEVLRAQNMKQLLGDALETIILAAPWAKSLSVFKGIGRAGEMLGSKAITRALRTTGIGRAGLKAAGIGSVMLGEAVEELNQYTYKHKYLKGEYEDDFTIGQELSDAIGTNLTSAKYALTGESGKGYEQDPEYGFAARSGAMLGGLMGGVSALPSMYFDERRLGKAGKDVDTVKGSIIDAAKNEYRESLYNKYVLTGKGEDLRANLVKLAEKVKPEEKAEVINEIAKLDKAIEINDALDIKLYGYNEKFKPIVFNKLLQMHEDVESIDKAFNDTLTELNELQTTDSNTATSEGARLKAKYNGIRAALDEYYGTTEPKKGSEHFERNMQEQLKEAASDYDNYLKENKLKDSDISSTTLDRATTLNTRLANLRFNKNFVGQELSNFFTTKGLFKDIKNFLEGKEETTEEEKGFNIDKPTLESYNNFESRYVGKKRYKYENEKITNELYNRDLAKRIEEGEDITSILKELNKEKPKLTQANRDRINKLRVDKNKEIADSEARSTYLKGQEANAAYGADWTSEMKQELDEIRAKNYDDFVEASKGYYDTITKPLIRPGDAKYRAELLEGFGKEADNLKFLSDTNQDFSGLARVENEIKRLKGLIEAVKEKEEVKSGQLQPSITKLQDKITMLEDLAVDLKSRIDKIALIDNNIPTAVAEQAFMSIGLDADLKEIPALIEVNNAIQKAVGASNYNGFLQKARQLKEQKGVLSHIYAQAIIELIGNASKENMEALEKVVSAAKTEAANKVINHPKVQERRDQINPILYNNYHINPDKSVDDFLAYIKDMAGFDANPESALYKFGLDRNLYELVQNVKTQDRDGARASKEEVEAFVNNHFLASSLHSLQRSFGNNYRQVKGINDEISLERKLIKARETNKAVPTPSKEQLRAIRDLVKFFLTPFTSTAKFANWSYMRGFAGTGKTTVVMTWVMSLLGLKPENVYSIGHLKHSAETIQKALGTNKANLIEDAINDLNNGTIGADIKLLVLDEVGGATNEQLVQLAEAVAKYNRSAANKVKVMALGDPNQITPQGLAPIDRSALMANSANITTISALTIRFRSNIEELNDLQDIFIRQIKDLTKEIIPTKSNTSDPTSFAEELLGANTPVKNFDDEFLRILQNRPPNSTRNRLLIVTDDAERQRYQQLLASKGLGLEDKIEILTYLEAQGTTRDEVFVNIKKGGKGLKTTEDYNTAIYTATSRATSYVFLGGFKGSNEVSSTIGKMADKREDAIKERSGKFMADREAELDQLDEVIPTASTASTNKKANTTNPDGTTTPPSDVDPENEIDEEEEAVEDVEEERKERDIEDDLDRDEGEDEIPVVIAPVPESTAKPITGISAEVKFPTYKNMFKPLKNGLPDIEGYKEGDKVLYVLQATPKGKKGTTGRDYRILIVKQVDDNNYHEIGVLSDEEIDNPPHGLETLYAKFRAATEPKIEKGRRVKVAVAQFTEQDEYLFSTDAINEKAILAEGIVGKAQPYTIKYSGEERGFKFSDDMNKFVATHFNTKQSQDPDKLQRESKVRIFTIKEATAHSKKSSKSGYTFKVIPGVPYLYIPDPAQTSKTSTGTSRDVFIQLSGAVLDANAHSKFLQPIFDFINKVERMELLLEGHGIQYRLGDEEFSKFIKTVTKKLHKLLPDNIRPDDFKTINKLRKEIHDLAYTYEEEFSYKKDKDKNEEWKKNVLRNATVVSTNSAFKGKKKVKDISADGQFVTVGEAGNEIEVPIKEVERVPAKKRKAGPTQLAFDEIAKANFIANATILRNYIPDENGRAVPQGRKLLDVNKQTQIHAKSISKYLNLIARRKGLTKITEDQLTEDEKMDMKIALLLPIRIIDLKMAFESDANGKNTANQGFGLRLPLDREKYTDSANNKGSAKELNSNFDGVTNTTLHIILDQTNDIQEEPAPIAPVAPNIAPTPEAPVAPQAEQVAPKPAPVKSGRPGRPGRGTTGSSQAEQFAKAVSQEAIHNVEEENKPSEEARQEESTSTAKPLEKQSAPALGAIKSIKEAKAYIKRLIPNITDEEMGFFDHLQMSVISGGKEVWGLYREGALLFEHNKDFGVHTNVLRHEVFHKIWTEFLTEHERKLIVRLVQRDVPGLRFADEDKIEEYLARVFQTREEPKGLSHLVKRILAKIRRFFGFVDRNIMSLDDLFDAIDEGQFSDRSGVAKGTKELVKILQDYTTTDNYRHARSLVINKIVHYVGNEAKAYEEEIIIDEETGESESLLHNIPFTTPEAIDQVKEDLLQMVKEEKAKLDSYKTEDELARKENRPSKVKEADRYVATINYNAAKSLTKTNKKGQSLVFNDLIESIYPKLTPNKAGEFAKDYIDTEEAISNEINGIQDYLIESDRQNHEGLSPQPIKDFLATLMDKTLEVPKLLNPRTAYYKLLVSFQNVDTSVRETMMEQVKEALGDVATNSATRTLYNRLVLFATRSEQAVLDDNGYEVESDLASEHFEAAFGNDSVFLYKDEEGNIQKVVKIDTPEGFFYDIKEAAEAAGLEFSYQTIKKLYLKQQAQEFMRALINNVGSLNAKNILQGVKTYNSGNTISYKYVIPREQGIQQAFRNNIEELIIDNFKKLDKIEKLFVDANNDADKVLAVKQFFNTIGIKNAISIQENNVEQYFNTLKGFMDSRGTVGNKETYLDEDGKEQTRIITSAYLVKDKSGGRMQTLTTLVSEDEAKRVISYRRADGKKAYMFSWGSFASKVVDLVHKPHLKKSRPDFFLSSLFKLNPIVNGSIDIYSYNEHDANKTADTDYDPILYSEEKEQQYYERVFQFNFITPILQGSKLEDPTYQQNTYTNSNKPTVHSAKMNVLKKDKIRKLVGDAIKQYLQREDLGIADFDINSSTLPGLSNEDVAKLRQKFNTTSFNESHAVAFEEAIDQVMDSMEIGARRFAERMINRKTTFDADLSSAYEKLKGYVEKPENLPGAYAQNYYNTAGKREYATNIDHILPLAELFYMNNAINGHFLNQLSLGDLAYYGGQLNVIKRMSMAHGMGTRGYVNPLAGGMKKDFNVAVSADIIEFLGEEFIHLKHLLRDKIKIADGAAFATPSRFADIHKGFGKHMKIGVSMKPVISTITENGVPRGMKYSLIVLTDELLYEVENGKVNKNKPKFQKLILLRKLMEDNNIDEWAFKSAFKYGAPKELSGHDEHGVPFFNPKSLVKLSNKDWRIQLNPMHDVDSTTRNPGQLTYMVDLTGKNPKYADKLYELNSKIMDLGWNTVKKELNMGNATGLNSILRRRVAKSIEGTAGAESQYEMLTIKDKNGKYMLPLNFPTVVNKSITQLTSIVTKAAISIRMPGSKLVLQPEYMHLDGKKLQYRTKEGYTEVILPNSYKKHTKEGDIVTMGFRIPSTGINNAIAMKVVGYYDDKGSNVVIAPWEIVYFHGSDYDIDALYVVRKKLQSKDLEFNGKVYEAGDPIGYKDGKRVYEQFEADLLAEISKVKAQLAEATQTGTDTKDLRIAEKRLNGILKDLYSNEVVDTLLDVVIANEEEALTPVSMVRFNGRTEEGVEDSVQEMIERILPETKRENISLNDIVDQAKIHQDNFSGRSLTGAAANFVKAVAYMFRSKLELPEVNANIRFNGADYTTLNRKEMVKGEEEGVLVEKSVPANNFKGEIINHSYTIAETFSSLVNAAIDNVKEQILPMINITGITAKAYMGMLSTGVPLHTAVRFFLTPGAKELSSGVGRYEDNMKEIIIRLKAKLDATELEGLKDTLAGIELTDALMEELMQDKELAKLVSGEEADVLKENVMAQLKIFDMMDQANIVGSALSDYSSFLSILNAIPHDYAGMSDIEDFYNETMNPVTGLSYGGFAFKDVNIIKDEHIAKAYNVLKEFKDFIGKLYYKHDPRLVKLSKEITSSTDIKLDRKKNVNLGMIRDEFMKYMISDIIYTDGKLRMDMDTSLEKPYELVEEDSDYKRILTGLDAWSEKFITEVKAAKDTDPGNMFLKYIEIQKDWKTGLRTLSFGAVGNMDPEEIIDTKAEFDKLKVDGKYTKFQHNFVKYAALHNGLAFGTSSYTLVLPPAIYQRFASEMEKRFSILLRSSKEDTTEQDKEVEERLKNLKEHFMIQLAFNNAKKLNRVKGTFGENKGKPKAGVDGKDEKAVHYDYKYKKEQGKKYNQFERITSKDGDITVFIRLDNTENLGEAGFVYYRRLGNAPKSQYYQFSPNILSGSYSYGQVFKPSSRIVHVVDNAPNEDGTHVELNRQVKLNVGDAITMHNYSDVSYMNTYRYVVSEVLPVKDKEGYFDYGFEKAEKIVFSVEEKTRLQEESKEAKNDTTRVKSFITKLLEKYDKVIDKTKLNKEMLVNSWNKGKDIGMEAEDFMEYAEEMVKKCMK